MTEIRKTMKDDYYLRQPVGVPVVEMWETGREGERLVAVMSFAKAWKPVYFKASLLKSKEGREALKAFTCKPLKEVERLVRVKRYFELDPDGMTFSIPN